jgi:uncharacterized protein (TIGR03437 family)
MPRLLYPCFSLILACSAINVVNAQTTLTCAPSAVPPVVRGEGIAERVGDIVLVCTGGAPGGRVTGNLSVFLTVNITNRVASGSNTVTDVVLTIDSGSGPQPANVSGVITGGGTLVYNGLSFTLSPSGSAALRLANIRGAANQMMLGSNNSIQALLSFNSGTPLSLPNNQFAVGTPLRGLYAGFSSKLVCTSQGSPLPNNTASFAGFAASNAVFTSTRVTEGFADAFSQRSAFQNLNADSGTRILVRYTGFPQGSRLFVPDVVAGSDAVQPTAGGDFGFPASGGRYAPGGNGSLLLARVQGADANGAGGSPVFTPGAPGSGTVSFDAISELTLANGAAVAVYEVMDANPSVQESAQFPTFLGLAPFTGSAIETSEDVSFAPVSTVITASATAPIPRFQQLPVPSDCNIVGDCGARYFPVLRVIENSLSFTAQAGSNFQVDYIQIQNSAGGVLRWSTTVNYQNGSGWLRVSPTDGINNSTIRVDALPGNLAPGIYKAILTIDAGPLAGSRDIPITLTVTAAPPPAIPAPTVTSVLNAATFTSGALAPGSIATLMGTRFSGSNLSVAFDGLPAQVLFSNDTQLNVLVPVALASKTSTQLTVQSNGIQSAPQTVTLAPFAPGIFKNGILNENYNVNGPEHPAAPGSIIQIFATGLSGNGVLTARLGDQVVDQPYYAGPAPGLLGVQQVNLILPSDLTSDTVKVSVCGGPTGEQQLCSPAVQVSIAP